GLNDPEIVYKITPHHAHRDDLPEAYMMLQKRAHFTAPTVSMLLSKAMTAVREVNERVTYLATTQGHETHEIQVRCEDAQDDQALLRAQVSLLTRERRSQAMKAQIRALQRDVDVLQRQRIKDEDRLTSDIQHEHDRFRELVRNAEAGGQGGPADAGSSC
ncbi:hypothetical protein Tco_1028098, partial [Tanacetum coccineum]